VRVFDPCGEWNVRPAWTTPPYRGRGRPFFSQSDHSWERRTLGWPAIPCELTGPRPNRTTSSENSDDCPPLGWSRPPGDDRRTCRFPVHARKKRKPPESPDARTPGPLRRPTRDAPRSGFRDVRPAMDYPSEC